MIVEKIRRMDTARGPRLCASVRTKSQLGAERAYFTITDGDARWLPERGDAFLAALLMPAMSVGEELVVDAPVSGRLLESVQTVMEIHHAWWERLHPIRVTATGTSPAPRVDDPAVGLFFTAGVDSLHSLLKDRAAYDRPGHRPVTDLLYVNFEAHTGPGHGRKLDRIRHVAERTGCRPITVETNLRALTDPVVDRSAYHGAALAAVGLALQGHLGRCLIAARDHYRHLPPRGSHPLLDHLWSTERLEFVHDGAEAERADKIERRLAHSQLALDTLHVCPQSQDATNCGVCEACLRTMIGLELAGVLRHCRTLPSELDIDRLREVPTGSRDSRDAMRSMAVHARGRGRADIADAAEEGLRRDPWAGTVAS